MTEQKPAARGKRRALGRGLDALMPAVSKTGYRDIEVNRIRPNPEQPRQHFDTAAIEDLSHSIRQHGVVQPLVVAEVEEGFQIVVGERRWRAAKLAGLERVPVIVTEVSDRQTLELALIENLQRSDLNALEEALAYQRLLQDYGLTQTEIGEQVGKSRVAITNTVRLLALPEAAKRALVDGAISEGHARSLLGVASLQEQLAVLDRVVREDLTVRQTEALVRRLARPLAKPSTPERDTDLQAIEEDLTRSLGTRVLVKRRRQGGRIVIEYYSDDELQALYDRLLGMA